MIDTSGSVIESQTGFKNMKIVDKTASAMITNTGSDEGDKHEQIDDKTCDININDKKEQEHDSTASISTIGVVDTKCNQNDDQKQENNRYPTRATTTTTPSSTMSGSKSSKSDKPSTSSRRQKYKSTYITDDLIREKSPIPSSDGVVDEGFRSITVTVTRKFTTTTTIGVINGKRQVECNICKKHMAESRLANHIRLMHSDNKSIEYRINSEITDQKVVEAQEKGEKEQEKEQKENNEQKRSSITESVNKPFRCDHCGKSYAIKYTWQQHVKTHIEGRPKCPECGGTFATAFGLFRHRVRNHNVEHNFKVYPCPECSKEFFSTSELALHEQRHSAIKEFVCPECQKAFSVKGNLRIHMRTHAKEKLYQCDLCDGTFSHPYSLVSHRRIHTNDMPYKCEICNKSK